MQGRIDTAGDRDGHHSGEGRNIVTAPGHAGGDIFFAAVQMSRMPMILTDPHQDDDPVIFANSAFERLCGYPREQILGRNCRFLQGPDTDRATVRRIRDALAAGEDVHEEVLNYRRDGQPFWNALFVSPVYDPRGHLLYHFASQIDVTRRRQAEESLRQSQRMEALGGLASGAAHEFNNLMMIVLNNVQQVMRQSGEPATRERLRNVEWAATQAGRLTQQMLSFARRQFHDNRRVELDALVTGFDTVLAQMAGREHPVTVTTEALPAWAHLDPGQLEMALLALVRNAAEASPDGCGIAVELRAEVQDEERGTMIEIAIHDEGSGMSPETAQRAIEPFYTTKAPGTGSGLGLSMAQGFVEQSGGRLLIEPRPGGGTSVRMRLPASDPLASSR
ncbi:ATP-binding protein [Coralloluteibacterium stylophorae]|uniref:histidine kinase n=1 Tax=Coralloluteibacterium stylophorae TaxID=1776034 RepID=A0A8J8B018_9GAMM|nr:PAS domain-containing protein [Coralloluteibacterium stylophorae]MBS7456488.1 PAS domain-containing protein [Coralloluteibacterium stylophorae]